MSAAYPRDWTVLRNPPKLSRHEWPSVNGWCVPCHQFEQEPEQTWKDARLIAAAPALLAACRRASSELDGDPDRRALLAEMDRVIALAE